MSTRTRHLRQWSQTYGVDRRKARRMRRKAARTGEILCPFPGCALKWHRSPIHYVPGRGPVVSRGEPT